MTRETLFPVLLVDLDPQAGLARAVEESLCLPFRLVRARRPPPLEAYRGQSGNGEPVGGRDRPLAAVVCASTIDSESVEEIESALSELRGLPVLFVSDQWDSSPHEGVI